jgi:hypothetical protein
MGIFFPGRACIFSFQKTDQQFNSKTFVYTNDMYVAFFSCIQIKIEFFIKKCTIRHRIHFNA